MHDGIKKLINVAPQRAENAEKPFQTKILEVTLLRIRLESLEVQEREASVKASAARAQRPTDSAMSAEGAVSPDGPAFALLQQPPDLDAKLVDSFRSALSLASEFCSWLPPLKESATVVRVTPLSRGPGFSPPRPPAACPVFRGRGGRCVQR